MDKKNQRIRGELFEPAHQSDLISALLSVDPDMATSLEAMEAEADVPQDEDGESDAEDDSQASGE